MTNEERFQNKTLRPILKGQNSLLLAMLRLHLSVRKNIFYQLPQEQRPPYLVQAIQKDANLRGTLKGIVIGQFTEDEFAQYATMAPAIDKRMMQLTIQRLLSQLSVFDSPAR